MPSIEGGRLIARCLKKHGIGEVFGVVGYPVWEVARGIQAEGLSYFGLRHEQAAGFAAQASGYLRRHVGVALTVPGPGMANVLTAMGNATANCWPLVVLSGSSDLPLVGRGAFQEAPQLQAARPFCKWVGQPSRLEDVPRTIATAVRNAWYGRPGATYVDLPADVIGTEVDESSLDLGPAVPPPPRSGAEPELVDCALETLRGATQPLLIVGKGAAWADAGAELTLLVERTGMPFLPTPMGKGTIPDDHPLCVGAARTFALANADVIFLAGARFNWTLHLGAEPRVRPGVKVVQVDISPEELGNNVPATVGMAGDLKTIAKQVSSRLEQRPWRAPEAWVARLGDELVAGRKKMEPQLASSSVPMGYYRPLQEIKALLPRDALIVSDGAKTMDISRAVLGNYFPRHRLDAGTWGTMGIGLGFALAAQVVHPGKLVVAIVGDGAFGFDGLEVEAAVRYRLPIIWVVFVNNGIGSGESSLPLDSAPPVHAYTPDARYDRVMEAFGGRGYHCETPGELSAALRECMERRVPALINVRIAPDAERLPQAYRRSWLARQ